MSDFSRKIELILERDKRFKPQAYEFLFEALSFTQTKINRRGHVSARELLEGIRRLGLEQFGPMTETVFKGWGINSTEDFGEVVFNLVEAKLLFKREEDVKADFKDVYDFKEVFAAKHVKYDLK